ncbi:MAG TPA: hypothetical protein VID29_00335 [Solirubrobacteraceae bacterium]|jgi:hypothetical protein
MSHERADTEPQQRAAALIASIDVEAPASLHGAVRSQVARAAPRQRTWVRRRALLAGGLAAVAALAVAIVLALGPAGGPAAPPTVLAASAAGLRPATLGAPDENPHSPGHLAISAAGIPYPYWKERFGWRSTGARSDRLGAHTVTTVFYADSAGRRIGYSIVDGRPLAVPAGFVSWRHGRLEAFDRAHAVAGATVVTWRRAGHTCILVGSGVSAKTLLTLADWQVA